MSEMKWIPVKFHEATEEDKREYGQGFAYIMDCEMPEDGERILVCTNSGYVYLDESYIDDGFHLDSGNDWLEIAAWMPLPKPYTEGISG